jgi:YVTN family beta-propeller protein
LTNAEFIPLGDTGPDQILVNYGTNVVYVSLKNDNFIALINGSNNTVQEKIILQEPRAMSINPSIEKLYVASGVSNWFNVIDIKTNKVISATQIAHPIASVVNNITNQVYVADCNL